MSAELTEVRDYPTDEDPLLVALWRDGNLTPEEHLTTVRMPWADSVPTAEIAVETAERALRAAIAIHQAAVLNLARCRVHADRYAGPEYRHTL